MNWGVYALDGFEGSAHFRAGLSVNGFLASERSSHDYNETEDFDVVAVFGLQGRGKRILADYQALGVPVFVIDYGYVKRTNHAHDWRTGHWQVSLNALNVLSTNDDPERFEALGIEITDAGYDPDGYTLICTQTTGDASHGHDEAGIQEWVNDQW